MNIPNDAFKAAGNAVLDAAYGQELPESPDDLAAAALEAAAPIIAAQALREAAEYLREQTGDLLVGSMADELDARAAELGSDS